MNKRGLSPIVATILLISIAVVLALIVLFWARGFISEKIQKFDEPIENACERIEFYVEIVGGELSVINRGNVPIHGISVKEKGIGFVKILETKDELITIGDTVIPTLNEATFDSGKTYIVVPRILGETNDAKIVHTCDDRFGVERVAE